MTYGIGATCVRYQKLISFGAGRKSPPAVMARFAHEPASRSAAESGLSPAPTVIVRMEEAWHASMVCRLFQPFTPRCVEVFL